MASSKIDLTTATRIQLGLDDKMCGNCRHKGDEFVKGLMYGTSFCHAPGWAEMPDQYEYHPCDRRGPHPFIFWEPNLG